MSGRSDVAKRPPFEVVTGKRGTPLRPDVASAKYLSGRSCLIGR